MWPIVCRGEDKLRTPKTRVTPTTRPGPRGPRSRGRRHRTWLGGAVSLVIAAVIGIAVAEGQDAERQSPPPAATKQSLTAAEAVTTLQVAGRAPMTGYDRDLFAYREVDHDLNGCDVRNDVLRRDLTDITLRPGTDGCVVETGTLHDPYTGTVIEFERGPGTSSEVQIDHVVALGNAWAMGAQGWDEDTRHRFGNDPLNLLAVQGRANQQKGAGDAATWLPPNRAYRCEFVARQVSVKVEYALRVTAAEKDAMERVLSDCPNEPLLTPADAATP